MRILLQHIHTGAILGRTNRWEPDTANAREFRSVAEAIAYCTANDSTDVEFILRFRQAGECIDVPLQAASFAVAPEITRVQTHFQKQHTVTSDSMAERW